MHPCTAMGGLLEDPQPGVQGVRKSKSQGSRASQGSSQRASTDGSRGEKSRPSTTDKTNRFESM